MPTVDGLICQQCGKTFRGRVRRDRGITKFCSMPCLHDSQRKTVLVPCATCDKDVPRKPYELKLNRAFCNRSCYVAHAENLDNAMPRYWALVDKRSEQECWPWRGTGDADGYGHFSVGSGYWMSHRFSYHMHKGPIPDGMVVMHSCDYPPCQNPAHLSLGTPKDNIRDMMRKGRRGTPKLRGELHALARSTEAQVIEIRKMYADGIMGYKELADKYGYSETGIRHMINRTTWKHLS